MSTPAFGHLAERDQNLTTIDLRAVETNEPQVIERVLLGRAVDPFEGNRIYQVVATRHDKDLPGRDDRVTFAVERFARDRAGWSTGIDKAWGFMRERDAWAFLSSKRAILCEWTGFDGREYREVREGIGIPDAFIQRYAGEV